jgi:hypothetical protein
VAFVMLSLCYAQHLSYLLCTICPSPNILQYDVEFDICTIAMLDKLFGEGSFGGSIDHLARHQAILPIFLNKFGLLSMVWTITPTLITLPLVIHFQ